ncbi:hypothetical protein COLO4_18554 [Corchorus olitorius]|uniref:Uncharacterized protein n=1 Tax=Corchorus olitorius TaxID=93759 RepID=A0A1R3J8K9_9ROSI|nr:hypothetical protein COLO4_18554 [Corchorus olitorius]
MAAPDVDNVNGTWVISIATCLCFSSMLPSLLRRLYAEEGFEIWKPSDAHKDLRLSGSSLSSGNDNRPLASTFKNCYSLLYLGLRKYYHFVQAS